MAELIPPDPSKDESKAAQPDGESKSAPLGLVDIGPGPELHSSDRHLTAATVEFEKGYVDQPLWTRALAQAKDDRVAATAFYLSARATAMRIRERERPESKTPALIDPTEDSDDAAQPAATSTRLVPPDIAPPPPPPLAGLNLGRIAVLGAVCAVLIAGGAGYFFYRSSTSESSPSNESTARATNPARQAEAAKAAASAAKLNAERKALVELVEKIESLRLAGNWHVHVLYAGEWTRKEPGSAAAWNELGIGYEKLKQYDDAYAAANKAVALAPGNALYWRNLGLLNVELNLPDEAMRAFEKAVAANDQDIPSMVQIGLLNVRSGRLSDAKVALDKALAANADDAYTRCLKSLIATTPTAPKAPAQAGRQGEPPLKAMCRNPGEVAAPPVAAPAPAAAATAPPRGKR